MAQEDLCVELREAGSIPGRERSQCGGPEMEEVCSRYRTKDGTAEAWGAQGTEVGDGVGEEGPGLITGSCELW